MNSGTCNQLLEMMKFQNMASTPARALTRAAGRLASGTGTGTPGRVPVEARGISRGVVRAAGVEQRGAIQHRRPGCFTPSVPNSSGQRIRVVTAMALGGASETAAADEDVTLRCAGLSVSPLGFVAVLTPELCSIAQPQNALEAAFVVDCKAIVLHITSGTDQKQAESIEALTLLQLVQGIDVGVRLPYDALMQACPGVKEGSILHGVALDGLAVTPDGAAEAPGVVARLHVNGEDYMTSDAFEALALALRYKVPISMAHSVFEEHAVSTEDVKAAYPEALSVEESREMSHSITHNISVAWRINATPIGESDAAVLRKQLSERGTAKDL